MLVAAVDRAMRERRCFDVRKDATKQCDNFSDLLAFLPQLFRKVDDSLFDGELRRFFARAQIPFTIRAQSSGPAGLTTYDAVSGMRVLIHSGAWATAFPAMVGGNLCARADACLVQIFLHELVHVLLFAVYLELGMPKREIDNSFFSHYDPTHNILFTTWLRLFFGHDTIDNSLLIHGPGGGGGGGAVAPPPTFSRSVRDIEATCVPRRAGAPVPALRVLRDGAWQSAEFVRADARPHFSVVRSGDNAEITVPNGLLNC